MTFDFDPPQNFFKQYGWIYGHRFGGDRAFQGNKKKGLGRRREVSS